MKPEKTELGPIRTALFVPGNRPDRVDKAVATAADRVIIDLEDAVAFSQKEETRPVVRDKIIAHKDHRILVRVNALETDFLLGDLEAFVVEELGGLVLPKTESSEHVGEIHRLLGDFEKKQGLQAESIGIILLIESARALQNIYQITSAAGEQNREFLVALGAADYALDLGIEITKDGKELSCVRSRIPIACRAAGVEPPLDTPLCSTSKILRRSKPMRKGPNSSDSKVNFASIPIKSNPVIPYSPQPGMKSFMQKG